MPKITIVVAFLFTLRLLALAPPEKSAEQMLEAAIYRAKVMGDLSGAIEQFESIATRYAGKPVAAQALVEIGKAEEMMGHQARARNAYGRVLRDYPDQARLVARVFQNPESMPDPTLHAKGLSWATQHYDVSPSARCCMGMVYDEATRSTLLFGGFTPYVCFGDTWAWRNEWRQLSPATSPSARSGAGIAYDGSAKNVVLFGGVDAAGNSLNDTWTWEGTTWKQQFPKLSPPGRRFDTQGLAYDAARRRVVFFGGSNGTHLFGDTWIWDGLAKTWTQQFPASSPSPRRTVLAYDEAAKTVVLFGGHTGGALRNDTFYKDTWAWDGTTWRRQSPASNPSARGMDSMSYDASLRALVLFGGVSGPGGQLNDTWLWTGGNWKEIHPAAAPATRWNMGMVYDPAANGLLMFGGYGAATFGDTWALTRVP